jgi:MFS family permease
MKILEENELLLKFMIVNVCSGTSIGLMNLITPIFALYLHATSMEIGLIRGVTGFGDLLIVLPAGILVDYFGTRKMYVVSCLCGGIAIVICSFASSTTVLMLMMILYGLTRNVRNTSLSTAFFKNMGRIGARKIGWYKGSMMVGSTFIGPALGGILATAISFTAFFVFTAAFMITPLLMVLARLFRKNAPPGAPGKNRANVKGSLGYYGKLLKNKELVLATTSDCMNTAMFMTFTTFITVMVVRDLGLSVIVAAMLITARGGSNMFVVFFCNGMIKEDNHKLFMYCTAGTALGLMLLGIAGDIPLLMIGSLVTGVCSGMMTLITFNQVGSVSGEKGKIVGFNSIGVTIGAIVGPIMGGVIGDAYGISAVFLAMIPLYGALALVNLYHKSKIAPAGRATMA